MATIAAAYRRHSNELRQRHTDHFERLWRVHQPTEVIPLFKSDTTSEAIDKEVPDA